MTRDPTVMSRDFAVKIKSDLLQIRRISEQLIKGQNKKNINNDSCTLI